MANEILPKMAALLSDSFRHKAKVFEERGVMSVPIRSGAVPYLSYSFDKLSPAKDYPKGLFPFFVKQAGVQKMCDYMLFCCWNNKLFVLLVELKNGSVNVMKQLEAGRCFAHFIVDTLNRVEKFTLVPVVRLIAIRGTHLTLKRPTKIREVKYNNDFCTFEGGDFYLREFLK